MNEMRVIVRGQEFPSLKAAAQHFGVSRHCASTLLGRHGHLDTLGLGNNVRMKKPVRLYGHEWTSREEAAAALGISSRSLFRYLAGEASEQMRSRILQACVSLHMRGKTASNRHSV